MNKVSKVSKVSKAMEAAAPYAKAITAAIVAGLSALGSALDDGVITPQEYLYALLALVVASGAVWAVPNRPVDQTPDGGEG